MRLSDAQATALLTVVPVGNQPGQLRPSEIGFVRSLHAEAVESATVERYPDGQLPPEHAQYVRALFARVFGLASPDAEVDVHFGWSVQGRARPGRVALLTAERDAWRTLAIARGEVALDEGFADDDLGEEARAANAVLRAMGVAPYGEDRDAEGRYAGRADP